MMLPAGGSTCRAAILNKYIKKFIICQIIPVQRLSQKRNPS